jgi:hypothetical protein
LGDSARTLGLQLQLTSVFSESRESGEFGWRGPGPAPRVTWPSGG